MVAVVSDHRVRSLARPWSLALRTVSSSVASSRDWCMMLAWSSLGTATDVACWSGAIDRGGGGQQTKTSRGQRQQLVQCGRWRSNACNSWDELLGDDRLQSFKVSNVIRCGSHSIRPSMTQTVCKRGEGRLGISLCKLCEHSKLTAPFLQSS